MTANWSIALAIVLALSASLGGCTTDQEPRADGCVAVTPDGVSRPVYLHQDRVAATSRLRGLSGPVVFVVLALPKSMLDAAPNRRVSLDSTTHGDGAAACAAKPDYTMTPAVVCTMRVPDSELDVNVSYDPSQAHRAKDHTAAIARYVAASALCR